MIVLHALAQKLILASFGAQTSLGILKFDRDDEKEADQMGLLFMALAGYNPENSVELWKKMIANDHKKSISFLRTHPTDEKRLKLLNKHLPSAMIVYNQNKTNTYNSGHSKN